MATIDPAKLAQEVRELYADADGLSEDDQRTLIEAHPSFFEKGRVEDLAHVLSDKGPEGGVITEDEAARYVWRYSDEWQATARSFIRELRGPFGRRADLSRADELLEATLGDDLEKAVAAIQALGKMNGGNGLLSAVILFGSSPSLCTMQALAELKTTLIPKRVGALIMGLLFKLAPNSIVQMSVLDILLNKVKEGDKYAISELPAIIEHAQANVRMMTIEFLGERALVSSDKDEIMECMQKIFRLSKSPAERRTIIDLFGKWAEKGHEMAYPKLSLLFGMYADSNERMQIIGLSARLAMSNRGAVALLSMLFGRPDNLLERLTIINALGWICIKHNGEEPISRDAEWVLENIVDYSGYITDDERTIAKMLLRTCHPSGNEKTSED